MRRYGFHGLSYEYIALRLRALAPHLAEGRVIAAHLGNGASLCAMKAGRSVDTTMGFTALDGLMMGTRCGNLDPGVILYLEQQRGLDAKQVEDILYRRSGLLGVSGIASDMRTLEASDGPRREGSHRSLCLSDRARNRRADEFARRSRRPHIHCGNWQTFAADLRARLRRGGMAWREARP